MKDLWTSLLLACLFIAENRDEAIKIHVKQRKLKLAKFKQPLRLPEFDLPTTIYEIGLKTTNQILQEYGLIKQTVAVSKCVDQRFSIVIDKDH